MATLKCGLGSNWPPVHLVNTSQRPCFEPETIPRSVCKAEQEESAATFLVDELDITSLEVWGKRHAISAVEIQPDIDSVGPLESQSSSKTENSPFQKWVRTLHRRALQRQRAPTGSQEDVATIPAMNGLGGHHLRNRCHQKTNSSSSTTFVTHIRSPSISLNGVSVLTRPRRNTQRSSQAASRADRSSRASTSGGRFSTDSTRVAENGSVDTAVIERSNQRRLILQELITTEEAYIGDLRFLINVYVTILASLPSLSAGLRCSINDNLAAIVELHEGLLREVHSCLRRFESINMGPPFHASSTSRQDCVRPKNSLGAVMHTTQTDTPMFYTVSPRNADPRVAADIARVFSRKMCQFFVYEEYGAKYELMMKDIASASRSIPCWETYQKGLEMLGSALANTGNRAHLLKKSLTVGDLLIKPVQRVCKYPLLFAELLKYTPVCDCPQSHIEIENTLTRLREATCQINRATNDDGIRATLERSWLLQDRLIFPDQDHESNYSKNYVRSLGHIKICGALHVCWPTKEGVAGQYMIALLYQDWLCLAISTKPEQRYAIQACISVKNIRVEGTDNGKGLQCHTAPFSWKLVFVCGHQLYEIIMTACTSKEELVWRSHLGESRLTRASGEPTSIPFNCIFLDIKSFGTVFGKPGTATRSKSIQRAMTVGTKAPLSQVILKNTSAVKDLAISSPKVIINRSQSLMTTNARVPILAPSKWERARLETLLSDVWTRDILPFPGMTVRSRSEQLVRASATSMIRKLSVANLTSTFVRGTSSTSRVMAAPDTMTDRHSEGPNWVHRVGPTELLRSGDRPVETLPSAAPDEEEKPVTLLSTVKPHHDVDIGESSQGVKGLGAVEPRGPKKQDDKSLSATDCVESEQQDAETFEPSPATGLRGNCFNTPLPCEEGPETPQGRKTKARALYRYSMIKAFRSFFR